MSNVEIIDITDPSLLGASDATLEFMSMDVSTLSLSITVSSLMDDCPYKENSHYRIIRDGKTLIIGTCTKAASSIDGGKNTWKVVISDYFWLLSNSTYINNQKPYLNEWNFQSYGRSFSKVIFRSSEGVSNRAYIGKSMENVCSTARQKVVDFDYAIKIASSAEIVPFIASTSSYAGLLVDLLKWRPNATGWWDYTSEKPKLIIDDQMNMESFDVDLDKVVVESIDIHPRHDLVPPAVGFVSTTQSIYGASCSVVNSYPPNADLTKPGCLISEFDVGSSIISTAQTPEEEDEEKDDNKKKQSRDMNLQKMRVKGKPMPTQGNPGSFFTNYYPRLLGLDIAYGKLAIKPTERTGTTDDDDGYDVSATRYQLVEGSVGSETPGLKWCEVSVEQIIFYNGTPPRKIADMFPVRHVNGYYYGKFTVASVKTINRIGGTYVIGGDGRFYPDEEEPEEDKDDPKSDPVPYDSDKLKLANIARCYYEGTRITPWEGNITIRGVLTDSILGKVINIKNGRHEWETMNALIQRVSIDLMRFTTEITIGPPKHLSLDDMIHRSDSLTGIENSTKAEEAKTDENKPSPNNFGERWENLRRKKHPKAPGITASAVATVSSHSSIDVEFGFQSRPMYDDDGNFISIEVRNGKVKSSKTGHEGSTGSGWRKFGKENVYCNIHIDRFGAFLRAELSNSPIYYRPYQEPMDGMNSESTNPSLEDYRKPGYYSFLVASVEEDRVVQHQVGTICYDYLKGGSPMGEVMP